MDGLVSVIVPAYNRQAYIAECLDSVLAQSYSRFEILIIDDGSTDHTLEICRAYAQKDPRIKLLAGSHQGVSAARNLGLDAARGEYIFFVDSDDIVHPCLLETLVAAMDRTGAQMGGTKGVNVPDSVWEEYAQEVRNASKPGQTELYDFDAALYAMLSSETPFSVMGGVIMRRDWIGDTRYRRDLRIGEDFYFSYENLIKGASAVFLKQKWYLNRIHDSNTSWDYSYQGFLTRFHRRELVWQSEQQAGRKNYADMQKREIFGIFLQCLKKAGTFSADGKQMRRKMRQNCKTIAPAMKLKAKIALYAILYLPFLTPIIMKMK